MKRCYNCGRDILIRSHAPGIVCPRCMRVNRNPQGKTSKARGRRNDGGTYEMMGAPKHQTATN